ncbi:MAG TPA: hypothetical protein VNI01_12685 [Elusimicrobiota bacterium]|nr:hypothetical protein [Elusimicrobiota bacterium]
MMATLQGRRRGAALVALWVVSSVLMGAIIAQAAKRMVRHLLVHPEASAKVSARYLQAELGLNDDQYRRAYEVIRESFEEQLDLMPRRRDLWGSICDSLATASDEELLAKLPALQAESSRMPEANMRMVLKLRAIVPQEKRGRLGELLKSATQKMTLARYLRTRTR